MTTPLEPEAPHLRPGPGPTTADLERVRRRYASPHQRRPALLALVVVLVALLVGWLAWAGVKGSTPPVDADMYGFTITGDHDAVARVRVQRRDPGTPVVCTLRATAQSFVPVGEVDARVPGGTQKVELVEVALRTVSRATTVEVEHCRLA